jgi:hypothetical protein
MVTQDIESYQTQLQQYQPKCRTSPTSPVLPGERLDHFGQLGQRHSTGQALGYSMQNMDAVFKQIYPGYTAPQNYQQSYQIGRPPLGTPSVGFGLHSFKLQILPQKKPLTPYAALQAVPKGNFRPFR